MNIKLSKKQEKYAEAFEWMLNDYDYRQEGRSYLMAVCFIKMALDNPNHWIRVFDHWPPITGRNNLMSLVDSIVSQNNFPHKTYERGRDRFRFYVKPKPETPTMFK